MAAHTSARPSRLRTG